MTNKLTNEADFLLCLLYEQYTKNRKEGQSRFDAKIIGGPEFVQEHSAPTWPTHDIADAACELWRQGYAVCLAGDDEVDCIALADEGVAYVEERFRGNREKLFAHITALGRLVLGLL